MTKKITITGASGMIGKLLSKEFLDRGWTVVGLTRNPDRAQREHGRSVQWEQWDGKSADSWLTAAEGSDVIVNLAGENVAGGRWTSSYKDRILNSRVNAGKAVTDAIQKMNRKPRLLLQASAIGIYGVHREEVLDENAAAGDGFLAEVVQAWEQSVAHVAKDGPRVNYLRLGVVLSETGGMLEKMTLPYKMFVGGPVGGKQWLSWIHIRDVIGVILFLLENDSNEKVFNLTTAKPVTMAQFSDKFAKVLHRPSWLPVPKFMIRLLFGEMGESTILSSIRARPENLLEAGYHFQYPELDAALEQLSEHL